jgi:hypothetical protein
MHEVTGHRPQFKSSEISRRSIKEGKATATDFPTENVFRTIHELNIKHNKSEV